MLIAISIFSFEMSLAKRPECAIMRTGCHADV